MAGAPAKKAQQTVLYDYTQKILHKSRVSHYMCVETIATIETMVPPPPSSAAASSHVQAGDDAMNLTKNQKKKRRKRKTKETSEAMAEATSTQSIAAPRLAGGVNAAPLNPSALVHAKLMAEGFSSKEIELAMEEMWDKEMTGYDEFEAVLAHLKDKNGPKPQSHDELTSDMSSSKESTEPSMNGHAHDHHMDLGEKLDLVSDNEDLADAAFALSEWISKAARPSDVEDFCTERKSRAFPTVIRRAIEESSLSSFEEYLPVVLGLVGSIFRRAGVDTAAAVEMNGNLKLVLQQARNACLKWKDRDASFAERVALVIVTRISGLVQGMTSQSDDDTSKSVGQLEMEIKSLTSSLKTAPQGGIVDLIQNRDVQKLATEKASKVVNICMSSAVSSGANGHATATTSKRASATKDEVLLSLVGPDGLQQMNQKKLAHDQVRQKLKSAEARTSPEYQALKLNLSTFQAEQSIVQEKIEELKNVLKQLEDEDAMLSRKVDETQNEIARLDETCDGEIAELRKELAHISIAAESDNSVRTLANHLAVYESSVKDSFNVSSAICTGDENMEEIIPSKMGLYLTRARNYFRSEADCVQFLRTRVRALENEVSSLRIELENFTSLGLSTNARQISHSLSQKRENIEDDNHVIDNLCGEAAKMRDEIAMKLEKYASINKMDSHLSSIHVNILRGIVSAIYEIGLDGIGGLAQFVDDGSNGHVVVAKAPVAVIGSSPAVVRTGKGAADAAPAELATKLTWAKPDTQAKKAQAKSLVHIQEEELSSKVL